MLPIIYWKHQLAIIGNNDKATNENSKTLLQHHSYTKKKKKKNQTTKLIAFSHKMQGTLDEPGKKGFRIPIQENTCQVLIMQCDM